MPARRVTAGDRSHLLTIQAPAGTIAALESEIEEHVPAAITVTPIEFQRPEALGGGGLQAQTSYTVNVGYRTDLRPDFVLVEECCTERRFQIVAIIPTDRRDAIEMRCVTAG